MWLENVGRQLSLSSDTIRSMNFPDFSLSVSFFGRFKSVFAWMETGCKLITRITRNYLNFLNDFTSLLINWRIERERERGEFLIAQFCLRYHWMVVTLNGVVICRIYFQIIRRYMILQINIVVGNFVWKNIFYCERENYSRIFHYIIII